MMSAIRSAIGLSVGVLGLLALPVTAAEMVKTVQQGNVRAEMSYEKVPSEGLPAIQNLRLKISRSGQTLFNQAPPVDEYDRPLLDYGDPSDRQEAGFMVKDLDGDKEPEVIVDFFTGGAHCCTYSLIYRFNSQQNRYESINQSWGHVGYSLRDLNGDGRLEFESADNSFAYAFASFAGSGMPIQIWQYERGKMSEVTRQYPKLVYADATRWWNYYNESKTQDGEVKGLLAAYMGTKYLLGQQEDGWSRLRQAYRESDRQQFFQELEKFLKEAGYEG